jgi:hypothetical protein
MFDRGQACFIYTPIWFSYGAAALFVISCCDDLYRFILYFSTICFYMRWFILLSRFHVWLRCVLGFNSWGKEIEWEQK